MAACGREPDGTATPPQHSGPQSQPVRGSSWRSGEPIPPRFEEVSLAAGVDFVHGNGAFGQKWLPETMGSGCAFVDVDGDGDSDILLLSGADWPGHPTGGRQVPGLYLNDGSGRFTEATEAWGLAMPGFAMGVTATDMDGDGDQDLFFTMLGPDRLFRNEGGRFEEVGAALGVDGAGFGSSAAWFDHDRDGLPDLLVLDYVAWTPETDLWCTVDGTTKSYCTPESYRGATPRLLRNDGTRFQDITREAGLHAPDAKGLGLAILDYDSDGLDDVFIACDTRPNSLHHAERDGTYSEQGVVAGVAFDAAGNVRGAMGVDAGDWLHTGRPGLVIGNFSNEMMSLYENLGDGSFHDASPSSGVGAASLRTLAFGTFFFDYDLDGLLDIFVANGHLEEGVERVQPGITHRQPPHLFRNLGGGRFEDVAPLVPALREPLVGRGAAFADIDGDMDLDILVSQVAGPARLFRNDSVERPRAIRVLLKGGAGSTPDALGARVSVRAGERMQVAWARSGHSYASRSERALTFGLGDLAGVDSVTVNWPSGKVSTTGPVSAGTTLTLSEADARQGTRAPPARP